MCGKKYTVIDRVVGVDNQNMDITSVVDKEWCLEVPQRLGTITGSPLLG